MNRWATGAVVALSSLLMSAGSAIAETTVGPLRLIAMADGEVSEKIELSGPLDIVVEFPSGRRLVDDARVRWKLEGDLRANADVCMLSPHYRVTRFDGTHRASSGVRDSAVAEIWWSGRGAGWRVSNTSWHGVLVYVWVVDGRPAKVRVGPAHDAIRNQGAISTFHLTAEESRGFPIVLFRKYGRWDTASRWFSDPAVNAALVEMHLGNIEEFKSTVAAIPDVDVRMTYGSATLLHIAAESGLDEAVTVLLECGADPRAEAGGGLGTPLGWAVRTGRETTAARLTASEVARRGGRRRFPVELARALRDGNAAVALRLLQVEADWKSRNEPIRRIATLAVAQRRGDLVCEMADAGVSFATLPGDLLMTAIENGDGSALAGLLRGKMDADPAKGKTSPLQAAVARGSEGLAKLLLDAGADPNHSDSQGVTPLHAAVMGRRCEVAALLLVAGANPSVGDRQGLSPVDFALSGRLRPMVALLGQHGGRALLGRPETEARLETAIAFDEIGIIKRAVDDGWDPNTRLWGSWPPWFVAEIRGAMKTSAWLRENSRREAPPRLASPAVLDEPLSAPGLPVGGEVQFVFPPELAQGVEVAGIVDLEGRLLFASVIRSPSERLTALVLEAIPFWRFVPPRARKVPVVVGVTLSLRIKLDENAKGSPRAEIVSIGELVAKPNDF